MKYSIYRPSGPHDLFKGALPMAQVTSLEVGSPSIGSIIILIKIINIIIDYYACNNN